MKRLALALAAALSLTACGDKLVLVGPSATDASASVAAFSRLADSVSRAGGDTTLSRAYATLAELLREGGRISPIRITLDGVPTDFAATAQLTEFTDDRCATAAPCTLKVRNLIAFRVSDPRQVVQLSSSSDSDPIRAYLYPMFAPFIGPSASLVYIDGKGGFFFGSSGTQAAAVTTSETPCDPASGQVVIAIYPAPPQCTKADFTISFDAKAEPSQFLVSRNTATGSHTLGMAAQSVLGSRFQVTTSSRIGPPILIPPNGALPATLSVTTDSIVTLTLSITNPSSAPVTLDFSSGQEFDFTIADAATGQNVWTWSANKSFTAALTTQTIGPNSRLSFTTFWKPTRKGALVATGVLTSVSHSAQATAAFVVP